MASGDFRYSIAGVSRGETIADLPDLAATGTGEWVVLSITGQNASDTEQVFDMSQFQLYADGKEVQLDVGNAWVSGLLGFTPAYGNTDAILWAADEGHPFALTFLVPTGAQQLTLVAGDQAIDLSSALANQAPLAQDTTEASKPEYIEATVVDVIDAETIVIEKDGIQQTVRYLGIDVPTGDDCYASEAAEANRQLVEGKTVRLERQATDVDAQGNWVRDVWTPAEDGRYFLVSESLVSDGAATAGISEPNTRYAGWLLGSQSVAKAEERGLWGSCEEEATPRCRRNWRRSCRRPPGSPTPGARAAKSGQSTERQAGARNGVPDRSCQSHDVAAPVGRGTVPSPGADDVQCAGADRDPAARSSEYQAFIDKYGAPTLPGSLTRPGADRTGPRLRVR